MGKKKAKKKAIRKKNWIPPDDMPRNQVKVVLAGKQCGVKLRKRDGYCKRTPVPGQSGGFPHRCKYHAGMAGAPKNNQNARKYGIYSDWVSDEEKDQWDEVHDSGSDLSNEITIMKFRLRRALQAEDDQKKMIKAYATKTDWEDGIANAAFEPDERTVESGKTKFLGKSYKKVTAKRKLPDYKRAVHMIVLELGKLIGLQTVLKGGNALSPEEQAREARAAVLAMRATMNLEEGEE